MAFTSKPVKWKETELDQKIQLQQLEIEKQKIISRRFYIAIWLMIVFLLMGCAIYGLATENLGLGVPCLVFGFAIGLGGVEFLVIKSVVKNIRENRRNVNMKNVLEELQKNRLRKMNSPIAWGDLF